MVNINCAAELFKFDSSFFNYYKKINKVRRRVQYFPLLPKGVRSKRFKGVWHVGGMLWCYYCCSGFEESQEGKLLHLANHVAWTLNLSDLQTEEVRYMLLRKKHDLEWLIKNE